jgi:hypothetical protein
VWLHLRSNSINYIHPSTFGNASRLIDLNISGNKITSIDPETFIASVGLQWLNLNDNNITDIDPSTFRRNSQILGLHISGNELTSIKPGTFDHNGNLQWLNLERNRITDIHPSTLRNNSRLRHFDISGNKITLIHPDTFIHNNELTFLYLGNNNISEISNLSFHGLEQLEELDLSNNNIEELNSLVFQNTLTSTDGQNHQVSKLKHLNLGQNKIRSFHFELYFPLSSNSDNSSPAFELEYLNVSSNRLSTLNVTSVKWLKQTTAVVDLTGNEWVCECCGLGEAWQELRHKLTLKCAYPEQLQGKSWDAIEVFCSARPEDMNYKSNTSSEAVSTSTELIEESEVSASGGSSSVITTALIVTGVLLVSAIGVGLILAKVVRRQRNRPQTLEYCDVYRPAASYVSVRSYATVGSKASYVSVQSYADVGPDSSYATGYSYVSVQ